MCLIVDHTDFQQEHIKSGRKGKEHAMIIVLAILLIVQPPIDLSSVNINQLLTKSNVSAFKTKAIIRDNTRSTIGKKVY